MIFAGWVSCSCAAARGRASRNRRWVQDGKRQNVTAGEVYGDRQGEFENWRTTRHAHSCDQEMGLLWEKDVIRLSGALVTGDDESKN